MENEIIRDAIIRSLTFEQQEIARYFFEMRSLMKECREVFTSFSGNSTNLTDIIAVAEKLPSMTRVRQIIITFRDPPFGVEIAWTDKVGIVNPERRYISGVLELRVIV